MANLITLTTDFGTSDWFVGTMKGVMAGIAPQARLIDLTHEIPPGNVRAGAFALAAAFRYFPKRTVHAAVVDPGVGTTRKAIAVQTRRYIFIGPDNGVLSWALRNETISRIHLVQNTRYFLQPVSRTFHGRDIFAPAAAHISHGLPVQELGPVVTGLIRLPWPEPRRSKNAVDGEVLYVDRFGNAITNIPASLVEGLGADLTVFHGRNQLCRVASFYGAVAAGRAVAVAGSSGFLEIAVNGGSAAQVLSLAVKARIIVRSR